MQVFDFRLHENLRTMKNIHIIVALSSILLVACSEEFIELYPVSTVTVDALYTTDKDFQDAVIGCYSTLQNQYNSFWNYDLASDDVKHQWPTEDIRLRLDNFTYQNNEGLFLNSWRNYYSIIFRANTILSKIENTDVSIIKNKERHIGEAKFLRAFAYFDLVRIFGDVPMVISVITDQKALTLGREKVDKIYDEIIIRDLLDAETKLPERYSGADIGRATRGAAKALLGKAYLTHSDFVNAEAKLQEVTTMGYALLPNYNDLFAYTDEHHSEYIFDIEYEEGIEEGSNFTNSFSPQDPAVTEFYKISGGSGNSHTPSDELFAIFEYNPGDLRKEITVARGFTDENGNYIPLSGAVGANSFTKKYMTPVERGGDSPANWKLIRYADVLLMYAEALNENGKTSEALIYLNKVRERAGLEEYSNLTKDDAREKIYLERRLELSFEGHRWFDLVRTGRADDVLKPLGMKSYMTLFPIPLTEIQIVNNATLFPQNPGWN